jgi:hypothetical protein
MTDEQKPIVKVGTKLKLSGYDVKVVKFACNDCVICRTLDGARTIRASFGSIEHALKQEGEEDAAQD